MFFDITKCFDTINHAVQMSFYGFKDHASKWFQSYHYKREQIVSCQNQLSGKGQLSGKYTSGRTTRTRKEQQR